MRIVLILGSLALLVAVSVWFLSRDRGGVTWGAVDKLIALRAPDLETISTSRLAERLEDPADRTLLLNVRTEAEVEVSRIPGARRVEPGASASDLEVALEGVDRGRPVVVYCAVGVRAAGIVTDLEAVGFDQVEALEGSIFRWANEGRALEGDGGPASTVHPYNAAWGTLLDPGVRGTP